MISGTLVNDRFIESDRLIEVRLIQLIVRTYRHIYTYLLTGSVTKIALFCKTFVGDVRERWLGELLQEKY